MRGSREETTPFLLILFITFFYLSSPIRLYALNDTSIKWKYIKTPHFNIIYHENSRFTAGEIASKCEKVFSDVASFFGFKKPPPWKITVVVRNTDDIANGYALYNYDLIILWTNSLHWPIRDKHRWIDNVFYHELTHIFQQRLSSSTDRKIPAAVISGGIGALRSKAYREKLIIDPYFQTGFNILIPFSVAPAWFVEGIAQYVSSLYGDESYDPIRKMILRTLILEKNFPSAGDLLNFRNKMGVKSEMVYNAGFSLVKFIGKNYGNQALAGISKDASRLPGSFPLAVKKHTGESFRSIYKKWRKDVENYVQKVTSSVKNPDREKLFLKGEKGLQAFPRVAGNKLFYLSYSSFSASAEIRYVNLKDPRHSRRIAGEAGGKFDLTPDGQLLVYTRRKVNIMGHLVNTVWEKNLKTGETKKLLDQEGASEPAISMNGKVVAVVVRGDSTSNLKIFTIQGKLLKELNVPYGFEIHNPTISPDGNKVAFEIWNGKELNVGLMELKSGTVKIIDLKGSNERFPRFISDNVLLFSSSEGEIYNIFAVDLTSGRKIQLTNTLKGNMSADYDPKTGTLYYGCFTSSGFKICSRKVELKFTQGSASVSFTNLSFPTNLSEPSPPPGKKYHFLSAPLNVFPLLSFTDYQVAFGLSTTFSDQLFKHNVLFSAMLGTEGFQYLDLTYVNRQLPVNLVLFANRLKYKIEQSFSVGGLILEDNFLEDTAGGGISGALSSNFSAWLGYVYRHGRIISGSIENPINSAFRYLPSGDLYELHSAPLILNFMHKNLRITASLWESYLNKREYFIYLYPGKPKYSYLKGLLTASYSRGLWKGLKIHFTAAVGITSRNVDPFFEFYLGGLFFPLAFEGFQYQKISMPGYPYLSLHGEYMYFVRFGLAYSINTKGAGGLLSFHGLEFHIFEDAGNAYTRRKWWLYDTGKKDKNDLEGYSFPDHTRYDIVMGVRLKMNIFYYTPFDLWFLMAYPFNNIPELMEQSIDYRTRGKVKIYMLIGWSPI